VCDDVHARFGDRLIDLLVATDGAIDESAEGRRDVTAKAFMRMAGTMPVLGRGAALASRGRAARVKAAILSAVCGR